MQAQLEEDHMPKVGTPQVYEDPMEPWRPRVITEIPGPKSKELIKNLDKYQVCHFYVPAIFNGGGHIASLLHGGIQKVFSKGVQLLERFFLFGIIGSPAKCHLYGVLLACR